MEIYIMVGVAYLAGSLITALFMLKRIGHWRIKCVELEHDLARSENRTPRNINDL